MQLTPREFDKLLIYTMAEVALKRKAKGIKLNYPEAVAIISAAALDGARAGKTIEDVTKEASFRNRRTENIPVATNYFTYCAGRMSGYPRELCHSSNRCTTTKIDGANKTARHVDATMPLNTATPIDRHRGPAC